MTQQLESFQFRTKAQNLAQLAGRIKVAKVCDLEVFTVGEWLAEREACLERVRARFDGEKVFADLSPSPGP